MRGLLVPGRCAVRCHQHGLVGTSTAAAVEAEPAAYLTRIRIWLPHASSLVDMGGVPLDQLDDRIGRTRSSPSGLVGWNVQVS